MSNENGLAARSPVPVVRLSPQGHAFTTSADVAAFFDKRHSHVLRAIERLLTALAEQADPQAECVTSDGPDDLDEHQPNFGLMSLGSLFEPISVDIGLGNGAVRRAPAYSVSRDGFALLAMGFTGKQALAFKLAYIGAFNAMETRLRRLHVEPLVEDLEFGRGLRLKDKLTLHEQAYRASRALTDAKDDDERRQAYWQLYQINTTLGIPMPAMQAMGVMPLPLADSESALAKPPGAAAAACGGVSRGCRKRGV